MGISVDRCKLVVVEVLRWLIIVVPVYLAVWRYVELRGYTIIISGADPAAQFWGIVSACILGASLVIYLPLKIVILKYKTKSGVATGLAWRPSLLTYIFLTAAPVLIIILVAAKNLGPHKEDTVTSSPSVTTVGCVTPERDVLDPITTMILQAMVVGLTMTEWVSKLREEHLTYDLVTAMADDFFFAYDVMDFVTMATREEDIYHSNWVYVCFAFSFVAMFKYVPAQPLNITGDSGQRSRTAILVSMLCCEIPFVIIRIWTLAEYYDSNSGSDLLHPLKNIALIIFDIMQLFIIYKHRHSPDAPVDLTEGVFTQVAPQARRARYVEQEECNLKARDHWDMVRRRLVNKEAKMASKVSPVVGMKNASFVEDGGVGANKTPGSSRDSSPRSGDAAITDVKTGLPGEVLDNKDE